MGTGHHNVGGNLAMNYHPISRGGVGVVIFSSRFMLEKPELRLSLMSNLACKQT